MKPIVNCVIVVANYNEKPPLAQHVVLGCTKFVLLRHSQVHIYIYMLVHVNKMKELCFLFYLDMFAYMYDVKVT